MGHSQFLWASVSVRSTRALVGAARCASCFAALLAMVALAPAEAAPKGSGAHPARPAPAKKSAPDAHGASASAGANSSGPAGQPGTAGQPGIAGSASAATPPAGATAASAGSSAGSVGTARVWASCTEHIPSGAVRPKMVERFPNRGTSGYAIPLELRVEHGKGEVVLPQGFQVQTGSDSARALTEAGFLLPDPAGGAGPSLNTSSGTADAGAGGGTYTDIAIPFLVLPKAPGRHAMTLPPVPIAVARASGEIVTLCTQPHSLLVEDPTASIPEAKPRPNPPPRVQREEWVLAKQLTIGGLVGATVAALATWLLIRWMRRPRPVPPPPPPRPPWDVALEELRTVRFAGLVTQGRYAEHFDRVSDALRKYLGGRFGFDGLETTTFEMESALKAVSPPIVELGGIFKLLESCDLVKFARYTPSEQDCTQALDEAERIVQATRPSPMTPPKEAA